MKKKKEKCLPEQKLCVRPAFEACVRDRTPVTQSQAFDASAALLGAHRLHSVQRRSDLWLMSNGATPEYPGHVAVAGMLKIGGPTGQPL